MAKRPTIVYVDGFNLYVGAIQHTPNKWLDLLSFFRFLRNADDVRQVRYFTSLHIKDPSTTARQELYLRALRTTSPDLTVHLGLQKRSGIVCGVAKNICTVSKKHRYFRKREEKQVDVALASHMVFDVAMGRCDQIVLVSGDSDYVPALRLIRDEFKNVRVVIYVPSRDGHRRPAPALNACAHDVRLLPDAQMSKCLLPEVMTDAQGMFRRPPEWGGASAALVVSGVTPNPQTTTAPAAPPQPPPTP